ncbi:MAG TPA: hypothetical protein VJY35_13935, partial [Candidatus Eisenbacteria bacterium]|nr:hypothetical protein [Candidatus Eisenbacteria bacterium]
MDKGFAHRRRPGKATPVASGPSEQRTLGWLLDGLLAAIALTYLALLWRQAAPAVFASDECFHEYVAQWIGTHGGFPRALPEFYSGLPYFYPPLLHVLGALVFKLAGPDALRYVNVVLTGFLLLALRGLPIPGVPAAARRCAALLCIATPALSLYAVRFYAETLATLLAVLVVTLLLRLRAPGGSAGMRGAVALGLVTGLALLAKQPAVL